MSESPLEIARADSLDELMSRDPLALAKDPQSRLGIILALRSQREALLRAEAEGKRAPSKKAQKAAATEALSKQTLDDLGI